MNQQSIIFITAIFAAIMLSFDLHNGTAYYGKFEIPEFWGIVGGAPVNKFLHDIQSMLYD